MRCKLSFKLHLTECSQRPAVFSYCYYVRQAMGTLMLLIMFSGSENCIAELKGTLTTH